MSFQALVAVVDGGGFMGNRTRILTVKQGFVLLAFAMSLASCDKIMGKKDAGEDSGSGAPVPTATPTLTPTPVVAATQTPNSPATACQSSQQSVGANVVFLIDNSNSNSATDCPSPSQIGVVSNQPIYRCAAQTNREKAVLDAYDSLVKVAATDNRDLAVSSVAVVQFPIPENNVDGSRVMTNGWIRTTSVQADRTALQSALQFTRQPVGATPYGAGISAANRLYATMQNDGRARVVILVTDGEPTDRDPASTSAQAQLLRQQGVQVFTVYVTSGQTRSQRISTNQQMLSSWDQFAVQSKNVHWYSTNYNNLNDYLSAISGSTTRASLAQSITSPVDAACVDSANTICQRYMVETATSTALSSVVQEIIKTKTITCQP